MPHPPVRFLRRASCAVIGVLALLALSCSSEKNHAEREATAPPKPVDCVDRCLPDPGPEPVDCVAEEEGLEFAPIWDFDGPNNLDGAVPMYCTPHDEWQGPGAPPSPGTCRAAGLYVYDDGGTDFRHPVRSDDPADETVPPEWGPWPDGWEPVTNRTRRCLGAGKTGFLHLFGGPFRGWGGGMGGRAVVANGARFARTYCGTFDTCRAEGADFPDDLVDFSRWEGIALWARRGPDSQAGLRVALGDKYTDDDINYLMQRQDEETPRYCERHRECGCRSRACTPYVFSDAEELGTFSYCWDPEAGDPEPVREPNTTGSQPVTQYDPCGATACNSPYSPYPDQTDPQSEGKPCTTHYFRGGIVRDFCFDPETDPPPAEGDQLCGDHWLAPVTLSSEWQFFKVPFTDLLQQGWAKESHLLDLTSVALIRLTFDKGWIDFWIDDVKLYRKKPE